MKYIPKKSKSTAIVLAVIFSYFTYIYTYKYNSWKFWLCFLLNLFLFWTIIVPIITWICVIIDMAMTPEELFTDYFK